MRQPRSFGHFRESTLRSAMVLITTSLVLSALLADNDAAWADEVHFACSMLVNDISGQGPANLTFAYSGGATGTLTGKTPWGDISMPARLAGSVAGNNYAVNAIANINLLMPDKAALETCLTTKAKPGELNDPDMLSVLVLGCDGKVPAGQAAVPATMEVQIAVQDGEIDAFITRKYAEASSVAGGRIELSSIPPPSCSLQ
jgi:hypothetical protein